MTGTLKILSSVIVFAEVAFFAYLPYLHPKLGSSQLITKFIGCFTSGLFLGLALLHVLPESNEAIAGALDKKAVETNIVTNQQYSTQVPQYGSLIAIFTFIIILAIDTYFHEEIPPPKDSDDDEDDEVLN